MMDDALLFSVLLCTGAKGEEEEGDDADVLNCECLTHEYKSFPFLFLRVEPLPNRGRISTKLG
jgi:hypothetical protein